MVWPAPVATISAVYAGGRGASAATTAVAAAVRNTNVSDRMSGQDGPASRGGTCVKSHDAANCAQTFDCMLHVGVNADGVEGNGDAGTVASDDGAFVGEQRSLSSCFIDAEE